MAKVEYMPLLIAAFFLLANAAILLLILAANRRKQVKPPAPPILPGEPLVDPSDILAWEFEYARITASESMTERHTMVNFYLLIAGITTSGVLTLLARQNDLPTTTGAVLFWVLVGIGWIYFLAIIRLRQAWCASARAMNRIKGFCIEHARGVDPVTLCTAFLWLPHTLPVADKPWTVYFYAAMLISFLNSAAFVAGGVLLDLRLVLEHPWQLLCSLALLGVAFFAFHFWLYFAFLHEKVESGMAHVAQSGIARAS